jgi:hypothetical protein
MELLALSKFLKPFFPIWSQEIIGDFPKNLDHYSHQWLQDLNPLSTHQQWDLDCERSHSFLEQGDLKDLFDQISALKSVPRMEENLQDSLKEQQYPSWALFQVSGKKQHEIKAICHHLKKEKLIQKEDNKSLLDIGGGKGHLSRILALYHGYNAMSLDTDENLQHLGKKRLQKYPFPERHGDLNFIHHTFGKSETKETENVLFDEYSMSIGLHTCGELALTHLEKARPNYSLLNIGCCYQRLTPNISTNLSTYAKKDAPLEFTKYALTLATRGHTDISLKDYEVKKRVKYFRAALQLFTNLKRETNDFISVGSNHPRDYFREFSHYALPKMNLLGIEAKAQELDSFYNSTETQKNLDQIFKGNLVRWRFGRLIEKYLIYDRALSLVEKGHAARVFQIFDEKVSPRNLAISISSLS